MAYNPTDPTLMFAGLTRGGQNLYADFDETQWNTYSALTDQAEKERMKTEALNRALQQGIDVGSYGTGKYVTGKFNDLDDYLTNYGTLAGQLKTYAAEPSKYAFVGDELSPYKSLLDYREVGTLNPANVSGVSIYDRGALSDALNSFALIDPTKMPDNPYYNMWKQYGTQVGDKYALDKQAIDYFTGKSTTAPTKKLNPYTGTFVVDADANNKYMAEARNGKFGTDEDWAANRDNWISGNNWDALVAANPAYEDLIRANLYGAAPKSFLDQEADRLKRYQNGLGAEAEALRYLRSLPADQLMREFGGMLVATNDTTQADLNRLAVSDPEFMTKLRSSLEAETPGWDALRADQTWDLPGGVPLTPDAVLNAYGLEWDADREWNMNRDQLLAYGWTPELLATRKQYLGDAEGMSDQWALGAFRGVPDPYQYGDSRNGGYRVYDSIGHENPNWDYVAPGDVVRVAPDILLETDDKYNMGITGHGRWWEQGSSLFQDLLGDDLGGMFNDIVHTVTDNPLLMTAANIMSGGALTPIQAGLSLGQGVVTGNPMQILQGALGVANVGGFNVGSELSGGIQSALDVSPQIANSISSGIIGGVSAALGGGNFLEGALASGAGSYVGGLVADADLGGENSWVDKITPTIANQLTKDVILNGGANVGRILTSAGVDLMMGVAKPIVKGAVGEVVDNVTRPGDDSGMLAGEGADAENVPDSVVIGGDSGGFGGNDADYDVPYDAGLEFGDFGGENSFDTGAMDAAVNPDTGYWYYDEYGGSVFVPYSPEFLAWRDSTQATSSDHGDLDGSAGGISLADAETGDMGAGDAEIVDTWVPPMPEAVDIADKPPPTGPLLGGITDAVVADDPYEAAIPDVPEEHTYDPEYPAGNNPDETGDTGGVFVEDPMTGEMAEVSDVVPDDWTDNGTGSGLVDDVGMLPPAEVDDSGMLPPAGDDAEVPPEYPAGNNPDETGDMDGVFVEDPMTGEMTEVSDVEPDDWTDNTTGGPLTDAEVAAELDRVRDEGLADYPELSDDEINKQLQEWAAGTGSIDRLIDWLLDKLKGKIVDTLTNRGVDAAVANLAADQDAGAEAQRLAARAQAARDDAWGRRLALKNGLGLLEADAAARKKVYRPSPIEDADAFALDPELAAALDRMNTPVVESGVSQGE